MIERFGYRTAILVALGLFAVGALLFLPASWGGTLTPFLMALFVLASGLACLETAANLYATTLGEPAKAEQRLTLAQSFNGLGAFIGPIIGGTVFFLPAFNIAGFNVEPVSLTYVILAAVVILMMLVFAVSELPEGVYGWAIRRKNAHPSIGIVGPLRGVRRTSGETLPSP